MSPESRGCALYGKQAPLADVVMLWLYFHSLLSFWVDTAMLFVPWDLLSHSQTVQMASAQEWRCSMWSVTAPDCQSFEPPGGLPVGRSDGFPLPHLLWLLSLHRLTTLGLRTFLVLVLMKEKGTGKFPLASASVLPTLGGVLKLTLLRCPPGSPLTSLLVS